MSVRVALLSVHPRHAENIITGKKRLEFRRSWAAMPVDEIVIYATSPTRRILGIAEVRNVFTGSPTSLWNLARKIDGCISRRELLAYLDGKKKAYAIELGQVLPIHGEGDPKILFGGGFRPPQSFRFLSDDEYLRIHSLIKYK